LFFETVSGFMSNAFLEQECLAEKEIIHSSRFSDFPGLMDRMESIRREQSGRGTDDTEIRRLISCKIYELLSMLFRVLLAGGLCKTLPQLLRRLADAIPGKICIQQNITAG